MLQKLRKLNPELEIYSIREEKFKKYGRVLNIDTKEIVDACHRLILGLQYEMDGAEYDSSKVKAFYPEAGDAVEFMQPLFTFALAG